MKWYFGANFTPSNAINQLEMWQKETFSPELIDRELGFAKKIGMNIVRVYLHDLVWKYDRDGFLDRIEQFLTIAEKHGIQIMPVFFDDCWNSKFKIGPQPEPKPFTHNSGWLQSPGNKVADNPEEWGRLEEYVVGVIRHFANDKRIVVWDLYNEPGNGVAGDHLEAEEIRAAKSLPLLKAVFEWARSAQAKQPLTVGVWNYDEKFMPLNEFQLANSDVVTFHSYAPQKVFEKNMNYILEQAAGRPVICTEYMARTNGNTFKEMLPIMRKANIGAINWGLVNGKTQTIYPWGWNEAKGTPELFFHDIFYPDGELLYQEERKVFELLSV